MSKNPSPRGQNTTERSPFFGWRRRRRRPGFRFSNLIHCLAKGVVGTGSTRTRRGTGRWSPQHRRPRARARAIFCCCTVDDASQHLPLAFGLFDGGVASMTEADVSHHVEGLLSRHDVWRGGLEVPSQHRGPGAPRETIFLLFGGQRRRAPAAPSGEPLRRQRRRFGDGDGRQPGLAGRTGAGGPLRHGSGRVDSSFAKK